MTEKYYNARVSVSPDRRHCVVFLRRHFTLTVPLSTQVYKWVLANLMLGVTLRWTSIPSREEQKYSQSLHATETETSSGLISHLALIQLCLYLFLRLRLFIHR